MASRNRSVRTVTHLIDADGQVLGRLATKIAELLRGKSKLGFTYHQDLGDKVVVYNVEGVRLTGRKAADKRYHRHSNYPGGLKMVSYNELNKKRPGETLRLAVRNMLPNNRLREVWLKRLVVKTGPLPKSSDDDK